MELTLKDQSVIEIGKEIGDRVGEFQSAGTALVPANQMAPAGAVAAEVQPMNPFESMMAVLSDIREGIYSLVDKFSEGVSLQDKALDQQEMAADAEALGATEDLKEAGGDDMGDNRSFLEKGKEKVNELMNAGGLKGLLVKGGLVAGLLLLAKGLQKYGKQIAEAVTPIIDGLKKFFGILFENIGPLFDNAVAMLKDLFGGLIDIFKGLFSGDAGTFFKGVKKLFVDFPIKLVSYIGDAFFTLLEAGLGAFGIDSQMVRDIKMWFRKLPENISQLFTDIGNFFTVTIPQKVQEIKDGITNFFQEWVVTPFTNFWNSIGTFFTETIPNKVKEITDGISNKFTELKDGIIDFAMAPFRKIKELMQNLLVGILESVEGLPFIGDKAKALKNSILGKPSETDVAAMDSMVTTTTDESGNTVKTMVAPQVNEKGEVLDPKTGELLKIDSEDSAAVMAAELTKGTSGNFEAVEDDGGFFGRSFYKLRKTGEKPITESQTTTSTFQTPETNDNMIIEPKTNGKSLNKEGADYAAAQGSGGGTAMIQGGNTQNVSNSAVTQNYITEDTTSGDQSFKNAIA